MLQKLPTEMNFKIIQKSQINKDGTAKLYVQYFFHSKKCLLPLPLKIEPDFFNKEEERVIAAHPRASEYNMILNKAKGELNEVVIRAKLAGIELTPSYIKSEFQNPSSTDQFYAWMVGEIALDDLSDGSRSAYNAIANKFNEFAPGIRFAEIDLSLIDKFDRHMTKKLKNEKNTRANAHKRLKKYLDRAEEKKMISVNPYDKFQIKKSDEVSKRVYLTDEEHQRFKAVYTDREAWITDSDRKVLRGFLFSCETGLRFSDMVSVRATHIIGDMLVIGMHKTKRTKGTIVKIPLTTFAKQLIKDSPVKVYGEYFKHLSEQKTNKALKRIKLKAKIDKHITTHVARHTFATLFWERTKDVATLQRLLGHSDIKQTMIYTHVSDEILRDQMKIFEES